MQILVDVVACVLVADTNHCIYLAGVDADPIIFMAFCSPLPSPLLFGEALNA